MDGPWHCRRLGSTVHLRCVGVVAWNAIWRKSLIAMWRKRVQGSSLADDETVASGRNDLLRNGCNLVDFQDALDLSQEPARAGGSCRRSCE